MTSWESMEYNRSQQSEAEEFDKLKDIEQTQMADDLNILNRVQSLEGKKVLDLGCGTGNYTYRLAERVGPTGRVIGVDPDKKRIKIASEKWKRDNITFLEGDDQTFPEDQYDVIFSNYVVHWIENKQQAIEKAYKNLRPGGQFAFVAAHKMSLIGDKMSALMSPESYQAVRNQWYFISTEEYKQLATDVGFTVTLVEEDIDCYTYPNVDGLLSSWYGITDGKFDMLKVEPKTVEHFKQHYAEKSAELDTPVIRMILTKQN